VAREDEVLSSESDDAQRGFYSLVVDRPLSILDLTGEHTPEQEGERIAAAISAFSESFTSVDSNQRQMLSHSSCALV
jgi:hypothetical protein